jgi:hypothetical protein
MALASAMVFAQAPQRPEPPPGVPAYSSTSRIVSATVVMTSMVRTLDGANSLNLMVLWRGSLEWFSKPGARGGSGGLRSATVYARQRYAGIEIVAELDLDPRAVRIQGIPATLKPSDANVILVDGVDGADLRVVSTLKIDPAIATDRQIEPLFKRSPEILAFLQCDQKASSPAVQMMADRSCQGVMGK